MWTWFWHQKMWWNLMASGCWGFPHAQILTRFSHETVLEQSVLCCEELLAFPVETMKQTFVRSRDPKATTWVYCEHLTLTKRCQEMSRNVKSDHDTIPEVTTPESGAFWWTCRCIFHIYRFRGNRKQYDKNIKYCQPLVLNCQELTITLCES